MTPFTITDKEFCAFRDLIHHEVGIFLREVKRQLVVARLARRLRYFGFQTFSEYYQHLMTQDPRGVEREQMVNCLTTNKTDFFREPHHFTFLQEQVFPKLRAQAQRGGPKRLRIWSAGCSSGEEAYSIAITIREAFGLQADWDIKVLASDIDTNMLSQAKAGRYTTDRVSHLPEPLVRKHFLRGTGEWAGCIKVRPELQQLIAFRHINLIAESWPIQCRFDVVFCRNVSIYFNRDTQHQLFERFSTYVEESGYLFTGHAESLFGLSKRFASLRGTIYRVQSERVAA